MLFCKEGCKHVLKSSRANSFPIPQTLQSRKVQSLKERWSKKQAELGVNGTHYVSCMLVMSPSPPELIQWKPLKQIHVKKVNWKNEGTSDKRCQTLLKGINPFKRQQIFQMQRVKIEGIIMGRMPLKN